MNASEAVLARLARRWIREARQARSWHLDDVRGDAPRMSDELAAGLLREAEAALGEHALHDVLRGAHGDAP